MIDFYCAEVKLCIEIDGGSHLEQEQQEYDSARTEVLESIGCSVIRFTNNDVRYDINAVAQVILDICGERKRTKKNDGNLPSS